MIPVRSFANCSVGVLGLARSGVAAATALAAGGAHVYAWDDKETARAKVSDGAVVPWRDWPWDRLKAVVLSPGIPLTHPKPHEIVTHALAAGVEVIGDTELFAREIGQTAPIIAITGTNGKSTTTALIGHILAACGFTAEVGGNIGKPVLELSLPGAKTIYVIEMSSYQIDLSPGFRPAVSILSNITPDHLDRHGSMAGYIAVKSKLLKQTIASGLVVIGVDDANSSAVFTQLSTNGGAPAVPVSVGKVLGRGIFVLDGALYDQRDCAAKVMDLRATSHLPGAHNWQNAALAYAATRRFVKDTKALCAAIVDFPGLAHRIEDVGRIGKVRYVNDSKATNAEAAERALVCFDDVFWIAGGKAKEGGIESLQLHFNRIRKAYLIGDAAAAFARTLDGKVPTVISETLDKAVEAASLDAANSSAAEPVVLLSPACASFDQFRDFEQRGDIFRDLVASRAASAPAHREAS